MAETKQDKKWYVVRAVSGQENKIKNYIENEISRLGLDARFVSIRFWCLLKMLFKFETGKRFKKKKLFSWIYHDSSQLEWRNTAHHKSITNVIGFLGETKGGEPVPLRKAEVNRMLR